MSKKLDLGIEIDMDKMREDIIDRAAEQLLDSMINESESYARNSIVKANREAIDKTVKATIDCEILPIIKGHLEKLTIQETNSWGEAKGHSLTFKEYLVKMAENYIREPVDSQGRDKKSADSYNWRSTQTRIAHMVHEHLHYSIESAMKEALKHANSAIVGGLEEAVKIKLAEVQAALKVGVSINK